LKEPIYLASLMPALRLFSLTAVIFLFNII
jgi:hypothetical protein